MGKRFAFDTAKAIQYAWDIKWAANLKRRVSGESRMTILEMISAALRRRHTPALLSSTAVRPLTEGYVVKGGRNAFPSQITERPAPPAPIVRRS